ncbi:MAG: metal ABC transporter permease [Rhodospirillaceae bacterium]|nr:metal ABC transporter permease [Rhodospirillaceae bacterium]
MTAFDLLLPAFALAVILVALHAYFGLHVLARGIVFVDLALAQSAALGISVGFALGFDPHDEAALGFAFAGAALAGAGFALLRAVPGKTAREVVIGCVYVVATAASIMILGASGQGTEEFKTLLNGSILFIRWHEIAAVAAVYVVLAVPHLAARARFQALSRPGKSVRAGSGWELLFFLTFAAMITVSVHLAGILIVFAFLIIPAFASSLLSRRFAARLGLAWAIGIAGSLLGLIAAFVLDLPAGPAIVAALGVLLGSTALVRALRWRR